MKNIFLEAALSYQRDFNFSIIPINPSTEESKSKKPLIKWEEFQKRRASDEEIISWWTQWPDAMIGIVCGSISGIFVLDADSEEAKTKLESLLPESFLCPIVHTPRPGYHYYLQNQDGMRNSNNGLIHCRGEGGYVVAPPSQKDDGSKYVWQISISGISPPKPPIKIINILKNQELTNADFKDTDHKAIQQTSTISTKFHISLGQGSRDETFFHVANTLIKGGESEENVYILLKLLNNSAIPPFPEKELEIKIKSALDRSERRKRNLSREVRDWVDSTFGNIYSTEIQKLLQISTIQEQKTLSMILRRLCDDGMIERLSKNGTFRKVENKAENIDIFSDTDTPLNLNYPLGIESFVHTMPKSIIIIAGESDAGKTAFLLNFSSLNLDYYPITYFSSEMGPTELKDRISKFQRPFTDWKKVSFKDRGSNFQDVIEPDKINIIDYLELADDFYKVGGQIKAIFDKLNKGIALIALQKKIGSELARGGDFTMEKSRIYITLSRDNICKIIKAKNWVNSMVKPTGKQRKYILLHGCEFRTKSNWEMEGQGDE